MFKPASRIALALFLSEIPIAQAADFTGQVVGVLDGDTLEVLHNITQSASVSVGSTALRKAKLSAPERSRLHPG